MARVNEQAIQAPPAQPPINSLLQACEVIDDSVGNIANTGEAKVRWQQGVTWAPEQPGGGGTTAIECAGDTPTMEPVHEPVPNLADPFNVYAEDHCSTFGFEDRDYEGRARRQLASVQSFHIARELQFGAIRTANGLNNAALIDGVEVGPGGQLVEDAIGCLEQAIAQKFTGSRLMIHVTIQTFAEMQRKNMLTKAGDRWLTASGHVVVTDAGYDSESQTEQAVFAYATTMIQVRLSPVVVIPGSFADALARAQMTDRAHNTIQIYAERLALLQFDHTDVDPADLIFKIELALPPWQIGS